MNRAGAKVIIEKLEVGPYGTNCYVVAGESGGEGMVIDPGAEPNRILKKIEALSLRIKCIVITHAHVDHLGALKEVKEATGAEIAVHANDAWAGEGKGSLGLISRLPLNTLPPPDRLLQGGESIEVGDQRFLVLHTPGHSPGGICLLGEGAVFSGDTLFYFSVGRWDAENGSYEQLIKSIHTKLMVLPDSTIVYPGHGVQTTIGNERQFNPFLHD